MLADTSVYRGVATCPRCSSCPEFATRLPGGTALRNGGKALRNGGNGRRSASQVTGFSFRFTGSRGAWCRRYIVAASSAIEYFKSISVPRYPKKVATVLTLTPRIAIIPSLNYALAVNSTCFYGRSIVFVSWVRPVNENNCAEESSSEEAVR